jgi:hypothetical protein
MKGLHGAINKRHRASQIKRYRQLTWFIYFWVKWIYLKLAFLSRVEKQNWAGKFLKIIHQTDKTDLNDQFILIDEIALLMRKGNSPLEKSKRQL